MVEPILEDDHFVIRQIDAPTTASAAAGLGDDAADTRLIAELNALEGQRRDFCDLETAIN